MAAMSEALTSCAFAASMDAGRAEAMASAKLFAANTFSAGNSRKILSSYARVSAGLSGSYRSIVAGIVSQLDDGLRCAMEARARPGLCDEVVVADDREHSLIDVARMYGDAHAGGELHRFVVAN